MSLYKPDEKFTESWWSEIDYLLCEIERLQNEIPYDASEAGDWEAREVVNRMLAKLGGLRGERPRTLQAVVHEKDDAPTGYSPGPHPF
jgi:hypothetical protein